MDLERKYTIVGRFIPQFSLPALFTSIPDYMTPEEFKESDVKKFDPNHIFALGDDAYVEVCAKFDNPQIGFCKKIFDVTHNKYEARRSLKSMKDMPFTLCTDGIVHWPQNKNEKLLAKPIYGTLSHDIQVCSHDDRLPDINEPYIVERYIPDEYQKVVIDGFIMGKHREILFTGDNIYHENNPLWYTHFGFPSIHQTNKLLREKYFNIVEELVQETGCNNQIIEIEFFVSPDGEEIITMEINPRCFQCALPIYEEISGYDACILLDSIRKGYLPERKIQKNGVMRYNYVYAENKQSCRRVQHRTNIFTDIYQHESAVTFAVSETKTYQELYNEIQRSYPIDMIKKM